MTDRVASPEEVKAAYAALSEEELLRLDRFAHWTSARNRRGGDGYSADALVVESMVRVLQGDRKWYKDKVPFFIFFRGVMRSIAGQWYQHLKSGRAEFEAQNYVVATRSDEPDPLESLAGEALDPEQVLIQKDNSAYEIRAMEKIREEFCGDRLALDVLDGWQGNMSPSEIQEALGISRKDFETVYRRLSRGIDRILRQGENDGR